MQNDKRKHPRLNANYLAWYRYDKGNLEYYDCCPVTLRNISAGGALFTTDEELEIDSNIDIWLNLPEIGRVFLPAVIVRVDGIKRSVFNFFNIAIKFIPQSIHEAYIEHINDIVERRLVPA